ncbi:MAG: aminopeptidase P family protein [Phycisphaerae bacterium]|nr:aminopeptidase P family protein [Phycisphaerae bacterium]
MTAKRKSDSVPRKDVYVLRRRAAMRKLSRQTGLAALLVTDPADVGYFTGFGGEGFLVMGPDWACLVPGHFFREQAEAECSRQAGLEIVTKFAGDSAIAECLKGRGVRRLGVQGEHVTLAVEKAIAAAAGKKKLVPIPSLKASGRMIKDDGEIRTIRKAVRIAQQGLEYLTSRGAKYLVGRTERDIAGELEFRMRQFGAENVAFTTIVAAGSHSSRCHHIPGSRKVKRGQLLLIDWGALVDGYRSDLTRTLFVGKISPKFREIYEIVLAAQKAGISAIRPGVGCSTVDAAARKVISVAGYGKEFCHGLGHGLGRGVHEAPMLSSRDKTRLKAGMVVTVEPGIYLPGVGGVRIEDDVLVTPGGCRRLSTLGRKLNQVILT